MNYPSLAIIFPTHNGSRDTQKCLESILKLDYPKNRMEIIIVDNYSSNETVTKIKNKILNIKNTYQKLKITGVFNKTNLGFAKAINQGVKRASSELILITNNDVVFDKNCVKEIIATMYQDPKIGAVGGKIYRTDRNKINLGGFRLNPYLAYHQFDLSGIDQIRECDWVPGTCLLTKRNLFLDLGGFDEQYFFYFEDVDFCLRLRKAGFKLFYTPKAIIHHGFAKTIFKEKVEKIFYLGYRARWRCLIKNANPFQILTSSFFLLLLSPCYQTFLTRHNAFKPMLKGLWSNLKDIKSNMGVYN